MITEGSRVLVFDHLLFRDDKSTPLSVTMRPATVLRRYGYRTEWRNAHGESVRWTYPDCIDVVFDHGVESRGHFTESVEEL